MVLAGVGVKSISTRKFKLGQQEGYQVTVYGFTCPFWPVLGSNYSFSSFSFKEDLYNEFILSKKKKKSEQCYVSRNGYMPYMSLILH